MEKINLAEGIDVYKTQFITTIPKNDIIKIINYELNNKGEEQLGFEKRRSKNDFVGLKRLIDNPGINEIYKRGVGLCLELINKDYKNYNDYIYLCWMNRVSINNPEQYKLTDKPYHDHSYINKSENLKGLYTFVYYLQIQNNLENDDAHLVLKNNTEEYSILPEEGNFLIHKSNIPHYPKLALKSTKDRYVIAGTVGII